MYRRARPLLLATFLGAVLATSATEAEAQATIRGILHDSLLTGKPVAAAEVVVLGANRKVITDERGRFEIADLPAGKHTLAFWAPWLDSLALPPLQRDVELGADGSAALVTLSTPSIASYQLAACGTVLEEGQGVLVGEIRGPDGVPLPDIGVATRWSETLIGAGQFERHLYAAVDTSNAAGFFTVCGVPVGYEIAVRAIGRGGVGSNEIVLAIKTVVQRRDLGVGPRNMVSRVIGRVAGAQGEGLAGATVAVIGDTSLVTKADDEGRFVLDGVPRRSTQLVARALGHVPALTAIELFDEVVDVDDLLLARIPQELATVTVTGEAMTASRLQFDVRKARGLGSFVGDAELARMPRPNSSLVSAMIPRTTVQQTRLGPMILLRRGSEWCRPRFFIDGYDNGDISAEEEGSVMSRAKRIEVYTANMSPPQFNDFDGCGAVVIWTR